MLKSIKIKVMAASRARKLEHFYSLCRGGRILDAGVSGKVRIPGENMFLSSFRYSGGLYVGLGVEDLTEVAQEYPDKKFITYDGKVFPFDDDEFDWTFSNAVIEHVGGHAAQVFFLNEMLRVSKNVYFTTPNKYFPVESHTDALFLHWLPGDLFYRWCAQHRPYWNRSNLQLLSHGDLQRVLRSSKAVSYQIFSNRLLGWPMTYSVVCKK